jgi:hypothetical protein
VDDDAIRRCCSRRSRSTSWSSPRGRPRRGRRRQGPARPWAASRLPCRSPPRWVWPASPSHRYPGSRGAGSSVALGRSPPGAGKDPRTRGPRSGGPPERRPRNARRPCRRSAACPRGRPSRSARRGRQPRGAERVDSSRMLAAHRLPTVAATATPAPGAAITPAAAAGSAAPPVGGLARLLPEAPIAPGREPAGGCALLQPETSATGGRYRRLDRAAKSRPTGKISELLLPGLTSPVSAQARVCSPRRSVGVLTQAKDPLALGAEHVSVNERVDRAPWCELRAQAQPRLGPEHSPGRAPRRQRRGLSCRARAKKPWMKRW